MVCARYHAGISELVGPTAAIIFERIRYFCEKAKKNKSDYHFHENSWWVFNSVKEWANSIPGLGERRIGYAIEKLVKAGLIKRGRFNRHKYDKTFWYAIVEEELQRFEELEDSQENKANLLKSDISQNCKMEDTNLLNGSTKIVEPIPNKSTEKSHNNKEGFVVFENLDENEKLIVEDLENQSIYFRQLQIKANQCKVARFYGTYEKYSESYNYLWDSFFRKNKPTGDNIIDTKKACLFVENCILKAIQRAQL